MTLNLNRDFIYPFWLFSITFGATTYYYTTAGGDIAYNGNTYFSQSDTQGNIQSIGILEDGSEGQPNIDIILAWTTIIHNNLAVGARATLIPAEMNPQSGIIQIGNEIKWILSDYSIKPRENITFTLSSEIIALMIKSDAFKTNSESQSRLTGNVTDKIFDYISGVTGNTGTTITTTDTLINNRNTATLGDTINQINSNAL